MGYILYIEHFTNLCMKLTSFTASVHFSTSDCLILMISKHYGLWK